MEERINGGCYSKSINIGKNVWFGGNVKILACVFISYNMIIGARSIFTKDVSLSVIAVGNSCKVIRQIIEKDKMGYKI